MIVANVFHYAEALEHYVAETFHTFHSHPVLSVK